MEEFKNLSNILIIYLCKDLHNLVFSYLNNYKNIKLLKKFLLFEKNYLSLQIFDIALYKDKIYIPIYYDDYSDYNNYSQNILEFNLYNQELSKIKNTNYPKKGCIKIYNNEIYISTDNSIEIFDINFNHKKNFRFKNEIEQFFVYKNLICITFGDLNFITIFDIDKLISNDININYLSQVDAIFLYNRELYILNVCRGEINIYNIENMQFLRKYGIGLSKYRHRIFVDDLNIYIIEPFISKLYILNKEDDKIIELAIPDKLNHAFYVDQNLIYLFVNGDFCIYELY